MPAVFLALAAHDGGHDGVAALQGKFNGGPAHGVGLLEVGLRGNVAGGALQVVGNGPVVLVAQFLLDHVGQCGGQAAQLTVAKGVREARLGQEASLAVLRALRGNDDAVTPALHCALHPGQELLAVKRHFRKQDDMGGIALLFRCEPGSGGDPPRVAAHDLKNENLGGGFAHRGHVQRRLPCGNGHILCDRTKARAGIRQGQVVVDGLGNVNGLQRVAHGLAELGNLQAGVRRVAATVIEEVANIMGAKHLDEAFVLGAVFLQAFQLVPTGAEGARGRAQQAANCRGCFLAGVYQILAQGADYAVAARVHFADLFAIFPCGFNNTTSRGIDDGGDAARLGIEGILYRHSQSVVGRALRRRGERFLVKWR